MVFGKDYHSPLSIQVAFGMDVNVIGEEDTKFTKAVSLAFHGVEEASFDLFHKVSQLPGNVSLQNKYLKRVVEEV